MTDHVFSEGQGYTYYYPSNDFVVLGAIAGEDVTFPDLCYLKSDGKYWKADADAIATTEGELAIALETIAADATGDFLKRGYLRNNSWSFSIADILYVSVTSGTITATRPNAVGDCVRRIGYAHKTNIIWFSPDLTVIEL